MIHNVGIQAGVWARIAQVGVWVTSILATGDLRIRAEKQDGSVFETELVSGMTFDVKGGYQSVSFLSSVSQTAKIWLSENKLNWSPQESRLVGASALANKTVECYYGEPKKMVDAESGRGSVTIYAKADMYIGGSGLTMASAIKVPANTTYQLKTQGEIFGYTDNPLFAPLPSSVPSEVSIVANGVPTQGEALGYIGGGVMSRTNGAEASLWYVANQKLKRMRLSDKLVSEYASTGKFNEHGCLQGDNQLKTIVFDGAEVSTVAVNLTSNAVTVTPLITLPGAPTAALAYSQYKGKVAFYAWGASSSLYVGVDGGVTAVSAPAGETGHVDALEFSEAGLWALYGSNGYFSTDNGASWSAVRAIPYAPTQANVFRRDSATGALYYFSGKRLFCSVDNGLNWELVYNSDRNINKFAVVDGDLFIAEGGRFVYLSSEGRLLRLDYTGEGSYDHRFVAVAPSGEIYMTTSSTLTTVSGEPKLSGGLPVAVMSEVN